MSINISLNVSLLKSVLAFPGYEPSARGGMHETQCWHYPSTLSRAGKHAGSKPQVFWLPNRNLASRTPRVRDQPPLIRLLNRPCLKPPAYHEPRAKRLEHDEAAPASRGTQHLIISPRNHQPKSMSQSARNTPHYQGWSYMFDSDVCTTAPFSGTF